MTKRVLMIAYHYPPVGSSSGVHRTLKFSQYLPEFGWEPMVLTVNPRVYEKINNHQLQDIPQNMILKRAFALDAARHLSIGGSYIGATALPDRWCSWWFSAVISGMYLIRKYQPDIIWSTYPIATAHKIGATLHRLTKTPWVADFRDSMTEEDYPSSVAKRAAYLKIEERAVKNACKVIFTTPGTLSMYARRYPDLNTNKWAVIQNGYDEEAFLRAEKIPNAANSGSRITLIHSGILYPSERDPLPFFQAVANLKQACKITGENLRIILRASGHDEKFIPIVKEKLIDDIVFFEPSLSYSDALAEMLSASGLLLFQAANCNHQIPAKLYEYFRAKRPIFALTDPLGDTADTLRQSGFNSIVRLDSVEEIQSGLLGFMQKLEAGEAFVASDTEIAKNARKSRTEELVRVFDNII